MDISKNHIFEILGYTPPHHCHLNATPMAEADAWLQRYRVFWNDKLDALEQAIKDGD